MSDIGASDNTKLSYLVGMQQFTDYTNKTPLQLIQEAELEIKSGLLMRERNITAYLREYRESFEKKGNAPLTVKNRMNAVCSFYRHYEIQLPVLPRSTKKAKPEAKRSNKITKEDLQEILVHADLLERAVIIVGASSGLSVNEIINLKVRDFTDGYDQETGITTLKLLRQKTDFQFVTFLTPEASVAVQTYLDFRNRKICNNGIRVFNQVKKQNVVIDKDGKPAKHGYLFIGRVIPGEYLKTKNPIEKEDLRKLDRGSILAMYRRLNEEAQKSTEFGEWNIIRSHNVRKYFFNQLDGKIPESKLEFMMAHEIEGTKKYYKWTEDPTELLEEYKKHMGNLIIEKQLDYTVIPEYQEMKSELAQLKTEKETLFSELREEIEKLKNMDSERAELINRFKPILDSRQDGITALRNNDFEKIRQLSSNESEEIKEHKQRIKVDKQYRNDFLEATSNKSKEEFEERKREITKKIIDLGDSSKSPKTFDKLLD